MDRLIRTNVNDVARLCEANYYDYIIVGSGMGGGVLARTLLTNVKKDQSPPRVLLIERGSVLFSTHVLNTPTPRWNPNDPDGPSMDNAIAYDAVRSPVTVTPHSFPHVGGPVYCLGGRSNLWGLYTPEMEEDGARRAFPESVCSYLFDGDGYDRGYDRAYQLLCDDSEASISNPYPNDGSITTEDIKPAQKIIQNLNKPENKLGTFTYCPMAAQFTHRDPGKRMYQMSTGGFSAVSWILDRIYNKSEHLHVLLDTNVVAINSNRWPVIPRWPVVPGNMPPHHETAGSFVGSFVIDRQPVTPGNMPPHHETVGSFVMDKRSVTPGNISPHHETVGSFVVRDQSNNERKISTGKATVILSAGTIETATIALRSGLGATRPKVGRGLTDHDIWGTRLEYAAPSNCQALRLQSWATSGFERPCLVNITVNAQSFLGRDKEDDFPTRYIGGNGKMMTPGDFKREKSRLHEVKQETSLLQVVFIFTAELEDRNTVLNLPESTPTVQIAGRADNSVFVPRMQECARVIGQVVEQQLGIKHDHDPNMPLKVSRAGFGVVAHEVGTMRMGSDGDRNAVVDENLKVRGLDNLYTCDLSVFPVSPSANPSLTLAALAQRLGDHLRDIRHNEPSKQSTESTETAFEFAGELPTRNG